MPTTTITPTAIAEMVGSPRPFRVVLDTNIVMDMLHFSNAHALRLLPPLTDGRWLSFTDADCLAELERVCAYPEFRLDATSRVALIERYCRVAHPCASMGDETYALPRCRDADDQKFLILAARCQADLLITRDKELLRLARHRRCPPGFAILTAEAAATLLGATPEDPTAGV